MIRTASSSASGGPTNLTMTRVPRPGLFAEHLLLLLARAQRLGMGAHRDEPGHRATPRKLVGAGGDVYRSGRMQALLRHLRSFAHMHRTDQTPRIITKGVHDFYQIVLGWQTYTKYVDIIMKPTNSPNPRPTQPKKKTWVKSGIWAAFSHCELFFFL